MINVRKLQAIFLSVFFFGCAVRPVGSKFPKQGLNPGHSSESTEFYTLDHQGTPRSKLDVHLYGNN